MAGSIEGKVLNERDGQPLSGANLTLDPGQQHETTGDQGLFSFPLLEPGEYDLKVTKDGFEDGLYGPLLVIDGNPLDLTLALQPKNIA